jgi:hypothetical protein
VTISIKTTGISEWIRLLSQIRLEPVKDAIKDILTDGIIPDAQIYPPEPPGSTYNRSYNLRDSWEPQEPSGGATSFVAAATNGVSYAAYVMGPGEQAAVHAGRWRSTDDLVDAWEDRVAAAVEEAMVKVFPK